MIHHGFKQQVQKVFDSISVKINALGEEALLIINTQKEEIACLKAQLKHTLKCSGTLYRSQLDDYPCPECVAIKESLSK